MSITDHGGATASPINRIHMYAHSFHSFLLNMVQIYKSFRCNANFLLFFFFNQLV